MVYRIQCCVVSLQDRVMFGAFIFFFFVSIIKIYQRILVLACDSVYIIQFMPEASAVLNETTCNTIGPQQIWGFSLRKTALMEKNNKVCFNF